MTSLTNDRHDYPHQSPAYEAYIFQRRRVNETPSRLFCLLGSAAALLFAVYAPLKSTLSENADHHQSYNEFSALLSGNHVQAQNAHGGSSSRVLKQQQIAREIALSFARELSRWSSPIADHPRHSSEQKLIESNTIIESNTTISVNQSAPIFSSTNAHDRGRDGFPSDPESQKIASDGGPGFEEPSTGTPSVGSDVSSGMAGENNFVLEDISLMGDEISNSWSDLSVGQWPGHPQDASAKFFPFGRDEVVTAANSETDSLGRNKRPEIERSSTIFPDIEEPNNEADALRVVDEFVPVAPTKEESAEQEGIGSGVANEFPDDIVPQATTQLQPRSHREHTDYDLQGSLPDLLVPSSKYDSNLGEDISPVGLQDAAFRVPDMQYLAADPSLEQVEAYPAGWGDRFVKGNGAVSLSDGTVFNARTEAARDRTSASEALRQWRIGDWLVKSAEAALEEEGMDLDDVSAPVLPEGESGQNGS